MKHKIVILDAGTFYGFPSFSDNLQDLGETVIYNFTREEEIENRIKEATVIVTNKVVLREKEFQQAPLLKLICVTATGTNNIELEAARKRNITVRNAKGYSTDSVAQTTFSMVLQLIMQLNNYRTFVENDYAKHSFFTHLNPGFEELNGKTWGIIGLGAIGQKVAELATAFGCQVIYHSPSGQNIQSRYLHKNLEELLRVSDIISIHTPLNEFTNNMLTYNKLLLCKKSAVIINVARGGIINEFDLKRIIDEDLIGGAASDVFSEEPVRSDNPLLLTLNKNKLLLTPHIAWGSFEAREKLMKITRENILEFITR